MKYLNAARTVTAGLLLAVTSLGRAETPVKSASMPTLRVVEHEADRISGAMVYEAMQLSFSAALIEGGVVETQVRIDGHVLDAHIDVGNQTAVLDGHGLELSIEQVRALARIGRELETYLDPEHREPLPHEDMLYRVLSSYTLGFAGRPMERIEVTASFGICSPTEALSDFGICGQPADNTEPELFISCNQFPLPCENVWPLNDDGICYLGGDGPDDGCACNYYEMAHDEYTISIPSSFHHCECREILGAGCSQEAQCRGRGGAKCSGSVGPLNCSLGSDNGRGIYTIDFAEHDRCCDVHENPFEDEPLCYGYWCLNEAKAALDDCLFGTVNCARGCCADDSECEPCERCAPREEEPVGVLQCENVACEGCDECDGFHDCTSYECCDDGDCDDQNDCTINQCIDHECVFVNENCTNDGDCATGNPCDRCVDGCCVTLNECFQGIFCNDGDPCTNDVCVGGCCETEPECVVDADCHDAIFCSVDRCIDGCCYNEVECATHADCNDGNPCSTDTCLPTGCCRSFFDCETDDDCTEGGVCHACIDGCCSPEPLCANATDCDDGNACTTDTCEDGCCQHQPVSYCGDGACEPVCGENCLNCPVDCSICSDGCCDEDRGEDRCSCPLDCAEDGLDCNGNGVPDDCELAGNDCNGNARPDECDVAYPPLLVVAGSPAWNQPTSLGIHPAAITNTSVVFRVTSPNSIGSAYAIDLNGTTLAQLFVPATENCGAVTVASTDVEAAAFNIAREQAGGELVFTISPVAPNTCSVAALVFQVEYFPATQSEDCNTNGVPDECELEAGDCNGNDIPDECELFGNDCNGNDIPDECELFGNDCNGTGIPDECELVANDCNGNSVPDDCELSGNDCNANGTPDDCDTASADCNGNRIPDDCELQGNDCNLNVVPDDCELAGNDCNRNGTPDDCELGPNDCNRDSIPDDCQLTANDCNANLTPDDCELPGNDCNGNGTPDECDLSKNDCNGSLVPDDCELEGNDCNGNGIPDECDLSKNDCNGNLVPDDCELEENDCNDDNVPDDCELDGNDCNRNGTPDECDIALGGSRDSNGNGRPDECEGACCAPECSVQSAADCEALGGSYDGDGTTCRPDPCMGACCMADGSCSDLTVAECESGGGYWQAGSTCREVACPQPAACCFYYRPCEEMLEVECADQGGTWNGTACADDPCPPLAPCCLAGGGCLVRTESHCSGAWRPDLESCSPNPCPQPQGACCFQGDCVGVTTLPACTSGGGQWLGNGTDCTQSSCPTIGSCCLNDTCIDYQAPTSCMSAGGEWYGGENCANIGLSCGQPIMGACCVFGTCGLELPQGACYDLFGTLNASWHADESCIDFECPPVPRIGACCAQGNCMEAQTEYECLVNEGGAWFDGETCSTTTCAAAVGACCYPDRSCGDGATRAGCLWNGGSWYADTACDEPGIDCTIPDGACCFADGTCTLLVEEDCLSANGVFSGVDTTCAETVCTGACCSADGSCSDESEDGCMVAGGSFGGLGSLCARIDCPAVGACCQAGGTCAVLAETECRAPGDQWVSGAFDCLDVDCSMGSCCLSDDSCIVVPELLCDLLGTYRGNGTNCRNQPCGGACCLPEGDCSVLLPAQCSEQMGRYLGDASRCTPDVCVSPMPGDADGDGDLDLDDLVGLPSCLTGPNTPGEDPDCDVYDFDQNEMIDLRDVAGMQVAFTGAS